MDTTDRFAAIEQALADLAAAGQSTAAAETALDALKKAWPPAFPVVNLPGVGVDVGLTFRYAGKHPLQGRMCRYSEQNGDIKKLLGYDTDYELAFFNKEPLYRSVQGPDGKWWPGYWSSEGRRIAKVLAAPIAAGKTLVVRIPTYMDQVKYIPYVAPGATPPPADPRNVGRFSLAQMAQGENGPAKKFYDALRSNWEPFAALGITTIIATPNHELNGNWYPHSAFAGQGGYWLLTFNAIGRVLKSIVPGTIMCWNAANSITGGMASFEETWAVSAADSAKILAETGMTVPAGTEIEADMYGLDLYNGAWMAANQVKVGMTLAQIDAVLANRSRTEGVGLYLPKIRAHAKAKGKKVCIPEWGTGYDKTGVPTSSPLNGKMGGDDYVFVRDSATAAIEMSLSDELAFWGPWERYASDGNTVLTFAGPVKARTGRLTLPSPLPAGCTQASFKKNRAAQTFVEWCGLPTTQQ